jgi:hypothetical protein
MRRRNIIIRYAMRATLGRHTSKVQPQHARASIISLSKEVSWLYELRVACFDVNVLRTIITREYNGITVINHPREENGVEGGGCEIGSIAGTRSTGHIYSVRVIHHAITQLSQQVSNLNRSDGGVEWHQWFDHTMDGDGILYVFSSKLGRVHDVPG